MADTRGEASSSERPQLVTVCRSVGAPRRSPGLGSNWSGPLVGRWCRSRPGRLEQRRPGATQMLQKLLLAVLLSPGLALQAHPRLPLPSSELARNASRRRLVSAPGAVTEAL